MTIAKKKTKLAREAARKKLREARNATNGFHPNDACFPFSEEFRNIPEDSNELQNRVALLEAKIKDTKKEDKRVLTEYKQRMIDIEQLRKSIEDAPQTHEEENSSLTALRFNLTNYIISFICVFCKI